MTRSILFMYSNRFKTPCRYRREGVMRCKRSRYRRGVMRCQRSGYSRGLMRCKGMYDLKFIIVN